MCGVQWKSCLFTCFILGKLNNYSFISDALPIILWKLVSIKRTKSRNLTVVREVQYVYVCNLSIVIHGTSFFLEKNIRSGSSTIWISIEFLHPHSNHHHYWFGVLHGLIIVTVTLDIWHETSFARWTVKVRPMLISLHRQLEHTIEKYFD